MTVNRAPNSHRRRLLLAAGSLAASVVSQAKSTPDSLQEVPVGGVLPNIVLRGLNGPSRALADYRGKPLVINVWASWCGPCIQEMASLERLAWLEPRPAFSLIGISTDDYRDRALGFLRHANATLTHYLDHDLEMETLLGAQHIPLTVVVDAKGIVRRKHVGARAWDAPEALAWIAQGLGQT